MADILQATAVIRAKDETGPAFDSVEARVKAVSKMVNAVGRDIARVGKVSGPVAEASRAFSSAARAVDGLAAGIGRVEQTMKAAAAAGKAVAEQIPALRQAAGATREAAQGFRALREEMDRLAAASGKLSALREGLSGLGGLRRDAREAAQALAALNREAGGTGAGGPALAERAEAARGAAAASATAYREEGAALAGLRAEIEATIGSFRSLAEAEAKIKVQAETAGAALRGQGRTRGPTGAAAGAMGLPPAEGHPAAVPGAARGQRAEAGEGRHGSGSQLAEVASLYGTIEAAEAAERVVERYREFDAERRYGKVVMGLTDQEQEPLVRQAIHESGESKFNDIQFLETQRELAARGYNKDQVLGFTPIVAKLGQSFDVAMSEAVKGLEGSMLAFGKDVSTEQKAHAAATRTADLEVKASKISGMDFHDIVNLYKYGAAPAKMAGLSEEMLLAFGAVAKKSNLGGDESGVAFRALAKNLLTPTAGAQVAMQGAGIDFAKYQRMPDQLDADGYFAQAAKRYGLTFEDGTKAGLRKLFSDKALVGDATRFLPAVNDFLKENVDPKMVKSLVALARGYRDKSAEGVDADGLLKAEIAAMAKNPALANAIFGSQQGGRIFAALGDPAVLDRILDELKHQSDGFANKVGDERMAGFDGAVSKLENSIANVESALGRAWDGAGSAGLATDATRALGRLMQRFAEADPVIQRAVTGFSAAGAAVAAFKSFGLLKDGFGLAPAAGQLEGAAVQLDAAARALQVVAGESDVAGAIPGAGGKGKLGRTVAREGEAMAEGAAEAAVGQRVAGAVETALAGSLRGGVSVGALEVAASAGVTLSATTVMLGALAAATIIDAIKSSTPPKPRASDAPGFGDPIAPVPGLDLNDPKYRAPEDRTPEEREQLKPWFNRSGPKHFSRGTLQRFDPTAQPGHLVTGPHGLTHWAAEDVTPLKHAPFFADFPLGPDGLPTTPLPAGLGARRPDPRTWAHIGTTFVTWQDLARSLDPRTGLPPPDPEPQLPAVAPLPIPRPADVAPPPALPSVPVPPRPGPAPIVPPPAAAPLPPVPPSAPVPVHVVSVAGAVPAAPVPPGMHRDFSLGNFSGGFGSPGLGAGPGFQPFPGHHAPEVPTLAAHAAPLDVAPHVDLSELDGGVTKAAELKGALAAAGDVSVSPKVDLRAIDALIAKLLQAKSIAESIGTAGGVGGAGDVGKSRVVPSPSPGASR